jgi:raffinose/stachyose/melibiose transport system substrate-binding protein/xylobiose transport system substrate-binding protein
MTDTAVRNRRGARRFRTAAIATAALAAVLAACGSSGPADSSGSGSGGSTFQVWTLQDTAMQPTWKLSIDNFNKTSKEGQAKLALFGNDPYKQKLRTAIGSPNAPDVFFNWGGGNLKEYTDANKVQDLTAALDAKPDVKSAIIPAVLDGAKIDGKFYGVPARGMQPVVLYYNKKVLSDAGVEPPKTWDDLLTAVDKLKAKNVTPIALAGNQTWTELMWAEYLLDRNGGPEVFEKIRNGDKSGWKDPAVIQTITQIQDLIKRGGFGTKYASVGYDAGGASTILAQGRAGFHLMGSWEYVNQLGQSPKFVKDGGLGWTAFPAVTGGKGDPSNVVGNPANYYSVTSGSKNVKGATDFVLSQMTSPEYIDSLIAAGDVPAVTGVEDKLKASANGEHAVFVYGLANDAKHFGQSWDQDLPAAEATAMLTELAKVFLNQVTPQQFADTLAGS